jgi:uncharacterized protein (DUF4415 family)
MQNFAHSVKLASGRACPTGELEMPNLYAPKNLDLPEFMQPDPPRKTEVQKPVQKNPQNLQNPEIPLKRVRKVTITIRLDPEIVDYFEGQGKGWHGRINEVLLSHVSAEKTGRK